MIYNESTARGMGSPEELSFQNEIQRLRALVAEFEGRLGSSGIEHHSNHEQHVGQPWLPPDALQTMVEGSADGIERVDREYRHLYVNPAFARMLGLSPQAIIGRTNRELGVADPLAGIWEEHVRRVFDSGRTLESEDSFPTLSGVRILESRFLAEHGPGGMVVSVVAAHRDITGHKRADEALRESQERLRFAQQVGGIGIFELNIQTGVDAWTPELEALHGLPPGGFPGTQAAWEDLIHPDDRDRAALLVKESFETGAPVEGEWRVIWPDGNVHWLAGRWQVFRDAAGAPLRIMGVNIDVTERKGLDEALRQSEERLRLAVKATNDAIWDIDLLTGTVNWSETYSTLYGRPSETSNSWQWWIDRIHPEDRERTAGGLRNAIDGGASSWNSEYRFQRPDGAWAHIYDRAYIARDASGTAWRVVGAMQDLTDRKQAEAALRESDLQYKAVFDNISVCLFLVDVTPDGRFKYVAFNPAEEEAVGLSNAEISGRFVEDIFHKELADKLTANYRCCLAAGRAIKYDDDLDLPGGRRYFHSNLIPLRNAAGVINRIIGACIDITDFRRTQEEALAKQNLESLGVLAGGIAHDFNNVLGGINAQAELIETDLPVGSELNEEIQRIKTAAMRGSEIVRGLMVYAGQDQSHCVEAVDVSRLIEEMLGLLKVSISKRAVLWTDLARDLPAVSANAPQIRQVVMNLVINASEAIGEKDGLITLSTRYVSGQRSRESDSATELPPDAWVRLEVSDTGSGITEEAKTKVFDPFFTTKFAGRGMGLAVVRRIVQDHGGTIHIVSTPGHGTTFQVLLPCAEKSTSRIQSAIPANHGEPASSETGIILVVEDEDLLRAAVSKSLRKIGFSVMAASDGSDAMEQMRAHKDDLDALLLDVTLPGTSSREVMEEARRLRPDLKVVVTSAYSKETIDASFAGLNVQQFIRKPFHLSEIVRLLKEPIS
jgi:two-component system cell cycle sensor histidine kinase/response regulator CckA